MPEPSPARYLAPTALAAVAIATLIILASGGGQTDTSDFVFATPPPAVSPVTPRPATEEPDASTTETTATTETTETTPTTSTTPDESTTGRTYVVQPGDTFQTISASTGVPVAEIQSLNPDADSSALTVGQKLRLGE